MRGKTLGYSLAGLFALISLVCGIVIYAVPGAAHTILQYLTHSTWQFTVQPFSLTNFIVGIVLWVIIGFVLGVVFSKLWEYAERQ